MQKDSQPQKKSQIITSTPTNYYFKQMFIIK